MDTTCPKCGSTDTWISLTDNQLRCRACRKSSLLPSHVRKSSIVHACGTIFDVCIDKHCDGTPCIDNK